MKKIFNPTLFMFIFKTTKTSLITTMFFTVIVIMMSSLGTGIMDIQIHPILFTFYLIGPMIFCIQSIPNLMIKLKNSSIIKRFGVSRVTKMQYFMTIGIYALIVSIFLAILTIVLQIIIGPMFTSASLKTSDYFFWNMIPTEASIIHIVLTILFLLIMFIVTGITMGVMIKSQIVTTLLSVFMFLVVVVGPGAMNWTLLGIPNILLNKIYFITPLSQGVWFYVQAHYGNVQSSYVLVSYLSMALFTTMGIGLIVSFGNLKGVR